MNPNDFLDALQRRPVWQDEGICAQTDPEAFYPEKGGNTRPAKQICASCPVKVECLEWAVENREGFGVWGGLSERERRPLLEKRHRRVQDNPAVVAQVLELSASGLSKLKIVAKTGVSYWTVSRILESHQNGAAA
jgi:WhiB family redox-sensing transcriptional regulator